MSFVDPFLGTRAPSDIVVDGPGERATAARTDHPHVEADVTGLVADLAARIAVSLVQAKGDLIVASASGVVARLAAGSDFQRLQARANATNGLEWAPLAKGAGVVTLESTTSSTFTDLATVGPVVLLVTGTSAVVLLYANARNSNANAAAAMGVAVSGASTVAALFDGALQQQLGTGALSIQATGLTLFTALTPGTNTFTAKYRAFNGGTATFLRRKMLVVTL